MSSFFFLSHYMFSFRLPHLGCSYPPWVCRKSQRSYSSDLVTGVHRSLVCYDIHAEYLPRGMKSQPAKKSELMLNLFS